MRCPACVLGGQRSSVHALAAISTCMSPAYFYDEDGVYHSHDWNTSTAQFHCSNGHRFVRVSRASCHVEGCTEVEPVGYWTASL